MKKLLNNNAHANNARMPMLFENLIDRKQLAKRLGISPSSVSKLMVEENLPFHKLGKSTRFCITEVATFLENRRR